jgi:hypothetical protein
MAKTTMKTAMSKTTTMTPEKTKSGGGTSRRRLCLLESAVYHVINYRSPHSICIVDSREPVWRFIGVMTQIYFRLPMHLKIEANNHWNGACATFMKVSPSPIYTLARLFFSIPCNLC